MKDSEHRKAAKEFADFWKGKGYEKGESQKFWMELLQNVLGVENPARLLQFEEQVKLDHTSFIDVMIPSTHVMIEQKSIGKDLLEPIKQSDGTMLKPFQQAKRYSAELPYSERPRWIVCSNFKEFLIYDMERPNGDPESILLENLESEWHRLRFLVKEGDEHVRRELEMSRQAAELIGNIYDALLKEYKDPSNPDSLRSLNVLCVRLVFCMYAEDTDIFGERNKFCDYMNSFHIANVRTGLIELFKILDTPEQERDPYLEGMISTFPYVNGGLFADENIEIPRITEEILDLIVNKACPFDWSGISPTIFGAMFESTLNPETRRSGGMHYTSIENIHKVIDPLFLNDLKSEFEAAMEISVEKKRFAALRKLQDKLASLKFLDPACGSGNFLTETYISLRRLENEIIKELLKGQMVMGFNEDYSPVKVSIKQFYGIEYNDFASTVAKTALWIAESQMLIETEKIVSHNIDFLPLTTNANIVTGDALLTDWNGVVPKSELNYIMGNPPFIGASMMTESQKSVATSIFGKIKLSNSIDYVGAWYFKSAEIMQGTDIKGAFVSTNSICQGEQVAPLWGTLMSKYGLHIDYAYRTFRWSNGATDAAAVHCIIVGFSCGNCISPDKRIYNDDEYTIASNINPYLTDAPDVFIESRPLPICKVPRATKGNQASDGGNLILSEGERDLLLKKYPELSKFVRLFLGAEEVIKNKKRYCLWLVDAQPHELSHPEIMRRITNVKKMREASTAAPTRKKAETPHLFFSITQPSTNYIMIPRVSSENRRYIPVAILPPEVIASDATTITASASLYDFGILISNVHMAWMRITAGRLKSDYRYSGNVVYNNFPWPTPSEEQKAKIAQTAQAILDARSLYPSSSLADLYNEITMPQELRRAHQANDRAVMEAYGLTIKGTSESDCVTHLFKMYQELTSNI